MASTRKPRPSRRAPRPVRVAVPLAVLALVGFLYWKPVRQYRETRAQVAVRQAQVSALRARNEALQEQVGAVASGPTLLRESRRLGLVRPGERLYIVKGIDAWREAHATMAGHG